MEKVMEIFAYAVGFAVLCFMVGFVQTLFHEWWMERPAVKKRYQDAVWNWMHSHDPKKKFPSRWDFMAVLLALFISVGAWTGDKAFADAEGDAAVIAVHQETGANVLYSVNLGEGTKVFTNKAEADAYGAQRIPVLQEQTRQEAIAKGHVMFWEGKPMGSEQQVQQWEAQQAADAQMGSHQSNLDIMQQHLAEMKRVKEANKALLENTGRDLDPKSDEYQRQVVQGQANFEKMIDSGAADFQKELESRPKPVSAKEVLQKAYEPPKVLISLEANKQGGNTK